MKITVLNHDGTATEIKTIQVTSVVLVHSDDDLMKMFFCNDCRESVFQYQGRIISIMPGTPPETVPFLIKCKRCHKAYRIIDII